MFRPDRVMQGPCCLCWRGGRCSPPPLKAVRGGGGTLVSPESSKGGDEKCLVQHDAAVNHDGLTGHVVRIRGGQVGNIAGDLIGGSDFLGENHLDG